jgi:AMP-polyphosphate phosphotransferase
MVQAQPVCGWCQALASFSALCYAQKHPIKRTPEVNMFDEILVEEELSKDEYSTKLEALEPELFYLEWKAREAKMPTLILIDGLYGTYASEAIQTLTERLDPRSLRVYRFQKPTEIERKYPWLWRFWMKLPNYGELAIFQHSWHQQTIFERANEKIKPREFSARAHEVNQLERMLLDDGSLVLKFWLHISKKEQEKRFKRADKDTDDFWDVSAAEWEQNKHHKQWRKAAEEVIAATNNDQAPWIVLNAATPRRNRVRMFEAIIGQMQARLQKIAPHLNVGPAPKKQTIESAIDTNIDTASKEQRT